MLDSAFARVGDVLRLTDCESFAEGAERLLDSGRLCVMHDRAENIAKKVLERPEQERGVYLAGATGGDSALTAAVLAAMARIEAVAADPGDARQNIGENISGTPTQVGGTDTGTDAGGGGRGDAAATLVSPGGGALEGPGSTIGQYKLLQLIGEGGFGQVFMAQQSHPVQRKLALKVVKPGMDSKQVLGRFETERRALGMMDHPNIARVYDAGMTPTGRPFFVMELVKGVPITEYCDDAKLSTRERLELFCDVCHAVQHAHYKGIVHRDIKPSNVLVTLHDGKAVVKVIDFGIAKAMNQDLSDGTMFTEFRQIVGTPEYMSPEQAAMSGLDVDARTDIFSLGVLLYELISGATPLDSVKLRSAGIAEIQRIIREDEPAKPSTRIARLTGGASKGGTKGGTSDTRLEAEAVAKRRQTDPSTLRRILAGDLDWICMKAMEKDRRRRYDTASALADDILRHLEDEPILARPPSTLYRMRKFTRRNRLAVGTVSGGMFALLLTLAALGYGFLEVRRERDKTAERETETRAQMLLSTMNAVRKYTADNVRPAMARIGAGREDVTTPDYHTQFAKEMVPGFSSRQVFLNFREAARASADDAGKQFVYKEAATNPTNRDDLADAFETELVRRFAADPKNKEQSGIRDMDGSRTYYIARPMVIKDAKCLDCHTTPEASPPAQVAMYGKDGWKGGYGWKVGDVVAAQVVYVPVNEAFRAEAGSGVKILGAIAGAAALGGVVSLLVLLRKA